MHLETIKHLRGLAVAYDDLVPIAKPLLLELLDSYEESATIKREYMDLAGALKAHDHAEAVVKLRDLQQWCAMALHAIDPACGVTESLATLRGISLGFSSQHAGTPACPDALNIVILQQLLKADDYDSMEAVKAAAQDYLHSLNACPLDFSHQPHDHCDGTPSSTRQHVNPPVSESALELVHTDMQGQIYGAEVIMHECAADDFATWFQHFKSHTITGTRVDQFDIHSVLDIMVEWIKAPFSLELPTASKPPQYLIISDERRTHGMVWFYAPDSKGYTVCTARAGRFTEAEAAAILAGTSGELSAMRESNLPKLQILHHIDRGYGDNGAILKTLITHALPTTESQPVNTVNPVIPVPAPETFEAHGHTWTRHTPGDPCPVPPDTLVHVLLREELHDPVFCDPKGSKWSWAANIHDRTDEIIGWRYAEPQPSTPAK
jgi:hypothetical protein